MIRKKGKMIGQNYQLDTDSGDQNGRGSAQKLALWLANVYKTCS